eukprot:1395488-Amorphochlora_amoeboformis.AAC.2
MWLPVIIALCAGTMVSLSEIPNKIWAGETRSDTLFARVQGKPFVEHNMLGYFPIELLVRYLEQVEREAELKGKYVQMERQSQEAAFSQLVKEYRSILKQLSSVISVDRYPVPYKRENVTKKPEEVNLAVSEAETDTDWITKTTMNPNLPQHSVLMKSRHSRRALLTLSLSGREGYPPPPPVYAAKRVRPTDFCACAANV